jgi:hypothetical protein
MLLATHVVLAMQLAEPGKRNTQAVPHNSTTATLKVVMKRDIIELR